ncbi:hypothetical protein [Nocardia heshunensis]
MAYSKLSRNTATAAAVLGLLAATAGIAAADPAPDQPGGPTSGQQCPPPPGDGQGQPPQGQPPQGQPPQGQPPQCPAQ